LRRERNSLITIGGIVFSMASHDISTKGWFRLEEELGGARRKEGLRRVRKKSYDFYPRPDDL